LGASEPEVIKAFDLPASWIATVIASRFQGSPPVLFGNYFPYLIPQGRNPLTHTSFRLFLLNLRLNVPEECTLCMSREQIVEMRNVYGQSRAPTFWPLPVGDVSVEAEQRAPEWGHVVSIGRLAPMKEYNLYMIDIVGRLRQRGCPVRWSVYGEGPLRSAMLERITALGLSDAITLFGSLPHSQFSQALRTAYLFVGMGTALVEAALCGVPGIAALAYDETGITYGPLYRLPFGNVGELTDTAPASTVESEIEALLRSTEDEYALEVSRSLGYAKQYDMDLSMNRFLDIVEKAPRSKIRRNLFPLYYLYHAAAALRFRSAPGPAGPTDPDGTR
jgi:glycosyltransferase involved in cell wall biosynthesis